MYNIYTVICLKIVVTNVNKYPSNRFNGKFNEYKKTIMNYKRILFKSIIYFNGN